MPKKEIAKKRTKLKAISKKSKKMSGKDLKKVKGGASNSRLLIGDIKGESNP